MDPDAELDAILEQVEAAGLVEQYTDDEGQQAMRLTPDGIRVARQLAMLGEDGQDELMAALLGEATGSRGELTERTRATGTSGPWPDSTVDASVVADLPFEGETDEARHHDGHGYARGLSNHSPCGGAGASPSR